MLSQFQNNNEVFISYWSHQLTKAERNHSTIEWEALVVVGAVKEFYLYLYGFKFKLITDHNPLVFLKISKMWMDIKCDGCCTFNSLIIILNIDLVRIILMLILFLDCWALILYLLYFNSWLLIEVS